MTRRVVIRVALWSVTAVVAVVALLAVLTFTFFWRSPGYYLDVEPAPGEARIISLRDYQDDHSVPYVYESGNVMIFGADHSRDPKHPQFAQIDQAWRRFDPTVALVEGRLGFLVPGLMDPVREFGETGRVNALAKRDDVPSYSWEVPWERIATELTRSYPPEQVALFFVLRPYFGQVRQGKPDSPDKYVEEYLHRASIPALDGTIRTVADIDRIWRRDFAGEPDWRDVSDEQPLAGYLNAVAEAVDGPRNRHLVRLVHTLASRGERVFVVCGASHAVQIEPALP